MSITDLPKIPFVFYNSKPLEGGLTYYRVEKCNDPTQVKIIWETGKGDEYRYYDIPTVVHFISTGAWVVVVAPELYTRSELSYIAGLEDRVELLEELCNDYAKIIAEKDYMIKMLQGMA